MFTYSDVSQNTFNMAGVQQFFEFQSMGPNGEQGDIYINANGDYSDATGIGETKFKTISPVGFYTVIYRVIVTIRDEGKFDSGAYGNAIVLTNGINLYSRNDNYPDDRIVTTVPIKTNPDWQIYAYDAGPPSNYGIGDEVMSVRWSLDRGGKPAILDGDTHDEVGVILNDDFRGLKNHYFHVQGFRYPKGTL